MKDSLAIAYNMKKKAKKMAEGGMSEDHSKMSGKTGLVRTDTEANQNHKGVHQHGYKGSSGGTSQAGAYLRDSHYGLKGGKESAKELHKETLSELKSMPKPNLYAEGGEVAAEHEDDKMLSQFMNHGGSIVDGIMKKRMYSEGGKVAEGDDADLANLADGDSAEFDDLELRDDLKSSNSGSNDGDSLGDPQEDDDRKDIVSRLMRQRAMKQSNPRPA